MENSVILGTSGKSLQQVMLNVNGNMQLVQLPEDSNITTLGGLLPHINNFLPQSADKYRLIIAETQTDLIGNESSLPVEKAKLVKNADGSTAFTLGLYALPIQSKAGGITRNELVSAVKAIIVADPTAKEFFTVEGKQYNMLKTDVLMSRYEDYNAKGKATKKTLADAATESVKVVKAKKVVKTGTKIAEVVESVKKAKTVKTKTTLVTETVAPIVEVPVTVEEVVAPVELIGSTKQQLIASIEALKSMINGVAEIVASLPDAVVEVAETKTAIEEVIYSFDEYLNSMRSNYVPLCERLPNTRC